MDATPTPLPEPQATTPPGVVAGQPITFGGVAAFAETSWRRLFIIQAIVALAGTAAMGLFLFGTLLPALDKAVTNLPENAYILRGELAWPDLDSVLLVDDHALAILVSPTGTHELGRATDIRVELRAKEFRYYSMFGYVVQPYPVNTKISLSRTEAEPWWGARRPFFIGGILVGTALGLWVTWMVLGTVYSLYAKFLAFWGNRKLSWSGAVKLSAAALLTPALVYSAAIAGYGLGLLPLEALLGAFLLHVVLGWIYVSIAPFRIGKEKVATPVAGMAASNPFDLPKPEEPGKPPEKPASNPFK